MYTVSVTVMVLGITDEFPTNWWGFFFSIILWKTVKKMLISQKEEISSHGVHMQKKF